MINPLRDDLITLSQASRLRLMLNPRTGRPRHISAITRYATRGARSVSGRRIRLEIVRTPEPMTSVSAVERFLAAINDPDAPEGVAMARSPAERRRDFERADRQLQEAGW